MQEIGLSVTIYAFSVIYCLTDVKDIPNVHEYLMKNTIKIDNQIIKVVFVEELCFGKPLTSQSLKCISLNKDSYLARPTFVDLNAN